MRYLKSPWLIKEAYSNNELEDIVTHCGDILQDLEHERINNETTGLKVDVLSGILRPKIGVPFNYIKITLLSGASEYSVHSDDNSYFKWSDISFYIDHLTSYLESKGYVMDLTNATTSDYDEVNGEGMKDNYPLVDYLIRFKKNRNGIYGLSESMKYLKSPWLIKESKVKDIISHCDDILEDLKYDTLNKETSGLMVGIYEKEFGWCKEYKGSHPGIRITIESNFGDEDYSYFEWKDISFYIDHLTSYLESKGYAMIHMEATTTDYDPIYGDKVKDADYYFIDFDIRFIEKNTNK